ncbi:MAG: U32 family peptidase, partial [Cytophagales bacterium]|nr:U32 family peptidase [Cytophagales bacterium]
GKKLGEWTDAPGSKAKKKKIYLGKGSHYYSNIKVAEFKMDTHKLRVGDEILITGPTTGALETTVKELRLNNGPVKEVAKGDVFSMPIESVIRPSDKLYKIVDA